MAAVVFVVVLGGAFLYVTRPVDAPSQDVQLHAGSLAGQEAEGQWLYRIDPTQSTARFTVGEILNGEPFTVVGQTNQVAADILIDWQNGEQSTVGNVSVNARTLKTDNPRRDGAISRLILRSEDAANEFITFEPTSVTGLPQTIEVSTPMNLSITGTLTISGVSREVTFTGITQLVSETELTGSAQTIVKYKDFNLTIPQVPFVAGVNEDVTLEIEFVAHQVNS